MDLWTDEIKEFCSSEAEIVIITNTITEIGNYQFCGFSKIAQIILPDGLLSIGNEAFAYCNNLNTLVIPKSVTHIGENIILGMKKFTEIHYGGSSENWNSIDISIYNTDLDEAKKYYCLTTE